MSNFLYDLISSIVTIFVVLNPVAVIPFFQGLTANGTQAQRRMIVNRAAVVVVVILLFFALIGDGVLTLLGITLHYIMIGRDLHPCFRSEECRERWRRTARRSARL